MWKASSSGRLTAFAHFSSPLSASHQSPSPFRLMSICQKAQGMHMSTLKPSSDCCLSGDGQHHPVAAGRCLASVATLGASPNAQLRICAAWNLQGIEPSIAGLEDAGLNCLQSTDLSYGEAEVSRDSPSSTSSDCGLKEGLESSEILSNAGMGVPVEVAERAVDNGRGGGLLPVLDKMIGEDKGNGAVSAETDKHQSAAEPRGTEEFENPEAVKPLIESGSQMLDTEPRKYEVELKVATRAVQLACLLTQRIQDRLLRQEERASAKQDDSLVTVADWGVQAVISWVLSRAFPSECLSIVAEEDTEDLRGMDGIHLLQRVVAAVNECLSEASVVGIVPPEVPLATVDVLKAISRGNSEGGPTGRHWVLDPVDGTLGFVRGDQYAVALAMIEDGKVVLGVLGCPNFPMRKEWLKHDHKYYRLASKVFPPSPSMWHKGCVMTATKGGGGARMEPLVWNSEDSNKFENASSIPIHVSNVTDPAEAAFCEPVEKGNSSHQFSAGVANSIGLRTRPLRIYSMAKYAAIARGDAEIFMKFAKVGYKEKIWDHAAGVLIVEEAGGVVTDARGRPLDFSKGRFLEGLDRGIIASAGKVLHSKIMAAVDDSWSSSTL